MGSLTIQDIVDFGVLIVEALSFPVAIISIILSIKANRTAQKANGTAEEANKISERANRIAGQGKPIILTGFSLECDLCEVKSIDYSDLQDADRTVIEESVGSAIEAELEGKKYTLYNLCDVNCVKSGTLLLSPVKTKVTFNIPIFSCEITKAYSFVFSDTKHNFSDAFPEIVDLVFPFGNDLSPGGVECITSSLAYYYDIDETTTSICTDKIIKASKTAEINKRNLAGGRAAKLKPLVIASSKKSGKDANNFIRFTDSAYLFESHGFDGKSYWHIVHMYFETWEKTGKERLIIKCDNDNVTEEKFYNLKEKQRAKVEAQQRPPK